MCYFARDFERNSQIFGLLLLQSLDLKKERTVRNSCFVNPRKDKRDKSEIPEDTIVYIFFPPPELIRATEKKNCCFEFRFDYIGGDFVCVFSPSRSRAERAESLALVRQRVNEHRCVLQLSRILNSKFSTSLCRPFI